MLEAFCFLGLIDRAGIPQSRLTELVDVFGTDAWPAAFRKALESAYTSVFALDLPRSSASELFRVFRDAYEMDGETARKGVTFFLHAARDAGIAISPFLLTKARTPGARGTGTVSQARRLPSDSSQTGNAANPKRGEPSSLAIAEKFLERLPKFDPDWPDDLKAIWLSAFLELVQRTRDNDDTE